MDDSKVRKWASPQTYKLSTTSVPHVSSPYNTEVHLISYTFLATRCVCSTFYYIVYCIRYWLKQPDTLSAHHHHHQIVIWICFRFSICQAQKNENKNRGGNTVYLHCTWHKHCLPCFAWQFSGQMDWWISGGALHFAYCVNSVIHTVLHSVLHTVVCIASHTLQRLYWLKLAWNCSMQERLLSLDTLHWSEHCHTHNLQITQNNLYVHI